GDDRLARWTLVERKFGGKLANLIEISVGVVMSMQIKFVHCVRPRKAGAAQPRTYGGATSKTGCSPHAAPLVELQRPCLTGKPLVACQPSQNAKPVNLILIGELKSLSWTSVMPSNESKSSRALLKLELRLAGGISTTKQSSTASAAFWVIST